MHTVACMSFDCHYFIIKVMAFGSKIILLDHVSIFMHLWNMRCMIVNRKFHFIISGHKNDQYFYVSCISFKITGTLKYCLYCRVRCAVCWIDCWVTWYQNTHQWETLCWDRPVICLFAPTLEISNSSRNVLWYLQQN